MDIKLSKQKEEIIEPIEKEREFKDILDGLKDGMKVHGKTDYHLDENFIWCKKPDDKWVTFHTRQHIVAKKIERSFLPIKVMKFDKDGEPLLNDDNQYEYEEISNPLAKKAFLLVMMPSNDWAIMNRNDPENMVLKGILTWGDSSRQLVEHEPEAGGKGLIPKPVSNFFKKKKKEQVIMGE